VEMIGDQFLNERFLIYLKSPTQAPCLTDCSL
jgi:hypothetical protein